jgi:hypothetical protein
MICCVTIGVLWVFGWVGVLCVFVGNWEYRSFVRFLGNGSFVRECGFCDFLRVLCERMGVLLEVECFACFL